MQFETFFSAQWFFLWAIFAIALVMGAVVNKTNFCTMGAVSDWVNMGDTGRFRAWLLAIAVAILGVVGLEYFGFVNPGNAFPPYRAGQLIWAENLLGGVLFGIGMTLASGCGNKTLVRLGAGNIKSLMVAAVIAVIAYFMVNPFPGSDQTLFTVLFYDWIRPLAVDLGASQDLGSVLVRDNPLTGRLVIGLILGVGLLAIIFRSADFRRSFDNILGGLVVGLVPGPAPAGRPGAGEPAGDRSIGHGDQQQSHQGGGEKAPDHHPGQGRLDLPAHPEAQGQGGEAEDGGGGGHEETKR